MKPAQRWCGSIAVALGTAIGLALCAAGCTNDAKKSAEFASKHAVELVKVSASDVDEIRVGLPKGAALLAQSWPENPGAEDDAAYAYKVLGRAREGVQELRVAKSTFFALVKLDGTIVRNDRDQDLMASSNLFRPFPATKQAVEGRYIETHGVMPEARGVEGRPDGQRVAVAPISGASGVKGLLATGWSWSAYAYRLEFSLRSSIRSALGQGNSLEKEPLVYVFVVVGDSAFGAPVSPEVNAEAVKKTNALEHTRADAPFVTELEISGRTFGLAVVLAPALGDKVAIAVLRSET